MELKRESLETIITKTRRTDIMRNVILAKEYRWRNMKSSSKKLTTNLFVQVTYACYFVIFFGNLLASSSKDTSKHVRFSGTLCLFSSSILHDRSSFALSPRFRSCGCCCCCRRRRLKKFTLSRWRERDRSTGSKVRWTNNSFEWREVFTRLVSKGAFRSVWFTFFWNFSSKHGLFFLSLFGESQYEY